MALLLDTADAAKSVGLAPATLAKMRMLGGGPPFVKVGTRVLYPASDLEAWTAAQPRRLSTSQSGGASPQTNAA